MRVRDHPFVEREPDANVECIDDGSNALTCRGEGAAVSRSIEMDVDLTSRMSARRILIRHTGPGDRRCALNSPCGHLAFKLPESLGERGIVNGRDVAPRGLQSFTPAGLHPQHRGLRLQLPDAV